LGKYLRYTALVLGVALIGLGSTLAGIAIFTHTNPIQAPIQRIVERFVPTPQQVFGRRHLLVLVEGLDYDYTPNDIEFSSSARSDIIKAVNIDFATKRVYVLSVPRDMVATFPNGARQKINAAQEEGGEKEAARVISTFLGIPGFDRYAVFRIDATKDIIDAIGGVSVYVKSSDCLMYKTHCSDERIDYDDSWGHLHVHMAEGWHHLDGSQAVGYARFRHDWCSDPCRIMRQDEVITALLDKLKNDKLNTFLDANKIAGVIHKDIETNLTQAEMLSLATYFSGTRPKDVRFAQIPYTSDVELADGDDLIPDDSAKAKLVRNMLIAPPLPKKPSVDPKPGTAGN
jgi:polyisoprenyl-teichoic acid--peptidoglycan teichoic acid transferase